MSAPHPDGLGARLAMERALEKAGLSAGAIGYINMHGTGSLLNDRVEDLAIAELFGEAVPCSSTKGWTGHTLGAAGAVEAVIALLALRRGLVPGNLNLRDREAEGRCHIPSETVRATLGHVLTNNFGFGGNNCCLLFSQADDRGGAA
jgi:3-oxoacyl-[acyl-carrier-protein] synthase-1